MAIIPSSFHVLWRCWPSNEILRMALLNWVRGKILQICWSHFGNTSIGKNVPESNIWGKPNKLMYNGIVVSDFTMLEKISPTPINRNNIMMAMKIISATVSHPWTSVNPRKKCPNTISTIILMSWNPFYSWRRVNPNSWFETWGLMATTKLM